MAKLKNVVMIMMVAACTGVCAAFLLPEKATEVQTAVSHYRTMRMTASAAGILEREINQTALPPMSGVVAEVYVKEGEKVSEGQVLYRVDSKAPETQLAVVAAQIQLAESVLVDGEVLSVSVQEGAGVQGGVVIGAGGYSVRANIADAFFGQTLPVGVQVDVGVITDEYVSVCVPIAALLRGADALMCVIDGVAVKYGVTLRDQDVECIAVEGLPQGVEVVLNPDGAGINEGDKVAAVSLLETEAEGGD